MSDFIKFLNFAYKCQRLVIEAHTAEKRFKKTLTAEKAKQATREGILTGPLDATLQEFDREEAARLYRNARSSADPDVRPDIRRLYDLLLSLYQMDPDGELPKLEELWELLCRLKDEVGTEATNEAETNETPEILRLYDKFLESGKNEVGEDREKYRLRSDRGKPRIDGPVAFFAWMIYDPKRKSVLKKFLIEKGHAGADVVEALDIEVHEKLAREITKCFQYIRKKVRKSGT